MVLTLEPLTALIGANGAGKSSTLQAIQFLFGMTDLDDMDCSDGASDVEISVTGTFTNLTPAWAERLQPWLNADGDLVLTRTRVIDGSGRARPRYSATRRQAPGFGALRAAVANNALAQELKALWAQAQTASAMKLNAWPNKPNVISVLADYERANPGSLTDASPDSSIGFGPTGEVDLSTMIELLLLPALRDASADAADTRGSTLTRLVDLTVRSGMDLDEQLAALTQQTSDAYQQIVNHAAGTGLNDLAASITKQLNSFAPGSSVQLRWEPRMPALAPPPVRATITESDHEADVGRQGHGVQRAYVFSLLRALLEARRGDEETKPALLLAVEEPEVYQHPIRARYVSKVLDRLAHATGTSTQVVYTTHSPLFVSIERIESVRQLRLTSPAADTPRTAQGPDTPDPTSDSVATAAPADIDEAEQLSLPIGDEAPSGDTAVTGLSTETPIAGSTAPPEPSAGTAPVDDQEDRQPLPSAPQRPRTRATAPSLHDIAERLERTRAGRGQTWTAERVAAQLPGLLGTAVSEGFFADKVVLVEGEEDYGFIHGAAEAADVDLYERGIAVVPVGGKDRLLLAHEVFHAAAVPTYVVFDTDVPDTGRADPGSLHQNRMIGTLVGWGGQERPGTGVHAGATSMSPYSRAVVEEEIGAEAVQAAFRATLARMGLPAASAKNGHVVHAVTVDLYGAGHRSPTLDALVTEIVR